MKKLAALALAVFLGACSANSDGSSGPSAPSAVVVFGTDSVVVSLVAGEAPAGQAVPITRGNSTSLIGLTVGAPRYSGASGWLFTSLDAGNVLTVTVDPRFVGPGSYVATVTVSASNAAPKDLTVRLNVRARPALMVSSSTITVDGAVGDDAKNMTLNITSTAETIGALTLNPLECTSNATRWLAATLSGASTPATVSLALQPAGLVAGSYNCALTLQSAQPLVDSARRTINVSLTLRTAPRIALDPATVDMTATVGNTDGPRVVRIINGGTGVLSGLALGPVDYGTGPRDWLSATLAQTTAPANVSLTARATSLAAGTYSATIPVTSTAADVANSPQALRVRFVVEPPPPPPPSVLTFSPSVLSATCRRNTQVSMGSFSTDMSDGATSTIVGGSIVTFTNPQFAAFAWYAPAPWVVPSDSPVMVACGSATGVSRLVQSFRAANGTTATIEFNVTIVP